MNKRKLIIVISTLTVAATIGNVFAYNTVSAKQGDESAVVNYNTGRIINKDGVKVTKLDGVNAKQMIDEDRVLVLKDNGVFRNPDSDIAKSYISIYNTKTKEYIDFKNVNMATRELHGVSPSGRYVLYGEPRIIPLIGSDEWQKAIDSGELFNEKRDILDLKTGEIIENFDKTLRNYEAQYKWLSDDLIFVDYGSTWSILNKVGKVVTEGKLDFTDCNSDYSKLIDVSEIKSEGDKLSGSFYYTKDFMGADGNIGIGMYSMDVNTKEEKLINKCEHSFLSQKQGSTIAEEFFTNRGEQKDGIYEDRTYGFKLINKNGSLIRDFELPSGRNFDQLKLSTNGEKCAYLEEDSFTSDNINALNNAIKVMDIKTGEVKEIAKIGDLMDKDHEEQFFHYKIGDRVISKVEGGIISDLSWNKAGDTLMFNYSYTSKDDGENYTKTYVVTFDK